MYFLAAMMVAMGTFIWLTAAFADRFFNGADLLGFGLVVGGIALYIRYRITTKENDDNDQ